MARPSWGVASLLLVAAAVAVTAPADVVASSAAAKKTQLRPGRRPQLKNEVVAAHELDASASMEPAGVLPVGASASSSELLLMRRVGNLVDAASILATSATSSSGSNAALAALSYVMGLLLAALPVLVFAHCCYRHRKGYVMSWVGPSDDYGRMVGTGNWAYGLIEGCWQAPGLFCFSACCGVVRWADTMAMAGLWSFMWAVMALLCFEGFASVTGLHIVTVIFMVHNRQKLRAKFGIAHGTCKTILGDLGAYCCCWPCAITQEARVTELALQQGFPGIEEYCNEGSWEYKLNETLDEEKARYPSRGRPPKQQTPGCKPICCSGV